VSDLILSGIETARPSRRHRLAARAKTRAESPAPLNMQPRLRQLPGIKGAGLGMGPIGPALIIQFEDGQGAPMSLTPDQARELGTGLITVAGQWEMLKKMHTDLQPVPTNPDLEQLLADAQANTAQHGSPLLAGEADGELQSGPDDLAESAEPAPNSFDINGKPVYEPPADESE
jgi:hypothetical protein